MWGMFVGAVLAAALMLFVPGAFALRAMRLPWYASIAAAPLVTVAAANVLSLVFCKVGIACTWMTVFVPLARPAIVWFAVAQVVRGSKRREPLALSIGNPRISDRFPSTLSFDAVCMVGAVVVGLIVTSCVYLAAIVTPEAYVESFDNVHHLAHVRAFAESCWWTSLGNTLYLGADVAFDPFIGGSFYPSAWHVLAAAVVQATGVSVACAINAVNTALLGIVLPLGTVAFLRAIFRDHPGVIAWGAVLATTFASGPLYFLVWGPLYPNLMAQCMVPAVLFVFVALFSHGASRQERVTLAIVLFVAFVSLVFAQPNGVFSAGVILAPLCVALAYRKTLRHLLGKGMVPAQAIKRARLVGLGTVVAIMAVWTACFLAPFMRDVVMFHWNPDSTTSEALSLVLSMGYYARGFNYIGFILVVIGSIACFVRKRNRWLVMSFVFSTIIYIVCVSTDGLPKQFLAGFWYTDSPRVAAIVALAAVPLQAVGADVLVRGACSWAKVLGKPASMGGDPVRMGVLAGTVMVAIILAFTFVPYDRFVPGKWGGIANEGNPLAVRARDNAGQYAADCAKIYDEAERAFVDEVLELVGPDAIVINEPSDGSAYAYGAQGLRTYYRYWRGYDVDDEKATSKTIRMGISRVATDADVQAAVREVGAQYVLHLDHNHYDIDTARMWTYGDGKLWVGIDGIRDDTQGFDVVLARDDMRLYKISL